MQLEQATQNYYTASPFSHPESAPISFPKPKQAKATQINTTINRNVTFIKKHEDSNPLTHKITSFFSTFFSAKNIISTFSNLFSTVKAIAFKGALLVAESVMDSVKVIDDFVKAIFFAIKTNSNYKAIIMPGMQIINGIGEFLKIPAAIGSIIDLFAPLKNVVWVPALGAVSAILSVAKIIYSGLFHLEGVKFNNALKEASNRAFLKRLSEAPENDTLRYALKMANQSLVTKVDEQLARLATGDQEELENLINEIQSSGIDQEVLKELRKAADLAYLDCIHAKDKSFLKKHFDIKGECIKSALQAVNSHTADEIHTLRQTLEGRLKTRKASNISSIIIDTISTVAAVILVVSAFVMAASPAAPVGYALLIGIGLYSVIKFAVDYKSRETLENQLLKFSMKEIN